MDYEFNILYYINMYKKIWKKIVLVVVISMFLTTCFSMLMPVTYVSTVTLLSKDAGTVGSSVGKFLGFSAMALGNSSKDVIIAILKSRRMSKDIEKKFSIDKETKFAPYRIDIRSITAGLAVDVKGRDPALTQKIAKFAIENLDKINTELDITPNKPMVTVLDPATHGRRESRQTPRKMLVAGMLAFLLTSLYAFFADYLKKLRSQ